MNQQRLKYSQGDEIIAFDLKLKIKGEKKKFTGLVILKNACEKSMLVVTKTLEIKYKMREDLIVVEIYTCHCYDGANQKTILEPSHPPYVHLAKIFKRDGFFNETLGLSFYG